MLRPRLTADGRDGVRCGFVTGTSGVASGNAAAGSSRPRALGVTRPSTRPAGFFLRGRTSRKRIRRLERGRPRVLPLPSWTRLSEPGRGLGGHPVTGGRVNHAGRAPRPPKNSLREGGRLRFRGLLDVSQGHLGPWLAGPFPFR